MEAVGCQFRLVMAAGTGDATVLESCCPFGHRRDLDPHLALSGRICFPGLPTPDLEADDEGGDAGFAMPIARTAGEFPSRVVYRSAFQPDGDGTIVDERDFHLRAKPAAFGGDAFGT